MTSGRSLNPFMKWVRSYSLVEGEERGDDALVKPSLVISMHLAKDCRWTDTAEYRHLIVNEKVNKDFA